MISLQHSGELVYHEIPSLISLTNPQDLIVNLHDHVTVEENPNHAASKVRKRQRDQSSPMPNLASIARSLGDSNNEHTNKKMVHREVEKKRRKDLATLYSSLRGLLPVDLKKVSYSLYLHLVVDLEFFIFINFQTEIVAKLEHL